MWQVSSNKSVINKTALRIRDIQAGHFAEAEHSTKNSKSHKKDIVLPRRGLSHSLSVSHTHTHKFTNLQRNKQTEKKRCTTQTSCITDNSRFPPFYFSFFAQSLERRTVPEGTAIPGRCSKRMEQAPSPTSHSKNLFNM